MLRICTDESAGHTATDCSSLFVHSLNFSGFFNNTKCSPHFVQFFDYVTTFFVSFSVDFSGCFGYTAASCSDLFVHFVDFSTTFFVSFSSRQLTDNAGAAKTHCSFL